MPKLLLQPQNKNAIWGVNVKIGEHIYEAGVEPNDKTFHFDVPVDEWNALKNQEIQYEFNNCPAVYKIRTRYSENEVDSENTPTLSGKNVRLNSDLVQHSDGHDRVKELPEMVTVNGVASGAAKAGDVVALTLNGHHLETTVKQDHTFSAKVDKTWFHGAERTIQAALKTENAHHDAITVQTHAGFDQLVAVNGEKQIDWIRYDSYAHGDVLDWNEASYIAKAVNMRSHYADSLYKHHDDTGFQRNYSGFNFNLSKL